MSEVLVPLDGSTLGERAIPLAVRLARATGRGVQLLQVVAPPSVGFEAPLAIDPLLDASRGYLEQLASQLRSEYGLEPTVRVDVGFPTETILRAAAVPDVAALVMSTHGRTGLLRVVMGSVAEQVLRESPVPVYLMPANAATDALGALERIIVPLDGSDFAYTVMGPVSELARRTNAAICLVRVEHTPEAMVSEEGGRLVPADEDARIHASEAHAYLTPIVEHLRRDGLRVEALVRFGDPAEQIVAVTTAQRGDLIAMSTHGRSGLDRLTHGSVAEAVLRHSPVPVMTFGREAVSRLWRDVSVKSG